MAEQALFVSVRYNVCRVLLQAGGIKVVAALQQCNALPLAAQLWKGADAQLRRSLMTAVSAVASAGE